jgi:hypothetical protein
MPLILNRNGKDERLSLIADYLLHILQAEPSKAFSLDDLAKMAQEEKRYTLNEVREAIWVLIDKGSIDLTPDRKLSANEDRAEREVA